MRRGFKAPERQRLMHRVIGPFLSDRALIGDLRSQLAIYEGLRVILPAVTIC